MSKIDGSILKKVLESLHFDSEGLIPAIAQQYDTGEVLMLAWMNRETILASVEEDRAVYWSRSRKKIWRKGESSGQVQFLKELRWDCDGDTVLLQVDQAGIACHTGRRSCFFSAVREGNIRIISDVMIEPKKLYK